jgi:ribonuclease HI
MLSTPHYLLFSEASYPQTGQSWRFVIQNVETSRRMVVSDNEPAACGERLELLAVVRGLEALDGPARVTLVTRSRYVSRGIRSGISEWRANDWQWERFGRIVPVKDCDLWQRIDRALLFHQVDCQAWQFEDAATAEPLDCRVSPIEEPPIQAKPVQADPVQADQVEAHQAETTGLAKSAFRCGETAPKFCEPDTPKTPCRLAPTRRLAPVQRQASPRRAGKRRSPLAPQTRSLGNLAAAVVNKATIWSESLRVLAHPMRYLVRGAA